MRYYTQTDPLTERSGQERTCHPPDTPCANRNKVVTEFPTSLSIPNTAKDFANDAAFPSTASRQASPLVEESAAAVAREARPESLTTQLFLEIVSEILGLLFAIFRQANL
jgi:hypothetical protein